MPSLQQLLERWNQPNHAVLFYSRLPLLLPLPVHAQGHVLNQPLTPNPACPCCCALPVQGYVLKSRGRAAGEGAAGAQHFQRAKELHLEAKGMQVSVLGSVHLDVAVSLQQAAASMAVS
jgi:hypothetical protein